MENNKFHSAIGRVMRCRIKRLMILMVVIIIMLSAILYTRRLKITLSSFCVGEQLLVGQKESSTKGFMKEETTREETVRKSMMQRETGKTLTQAVKEKNVRRSLTSEETVKEGTIKNLREITHQLIEIRSTLDEKFADFIDEKYNYFQKLLISLGGESDTVGNVLRTTDKIDNSYVCPEEYKGSTYGYPFFREGFKRTNCSKTPLAKLVTVILDNPCQQSTSQCSTERLIASFNNRHNGLAVHVIQNTNSPAEAINKIIQDIKTPFVLLAPYLARYDDDVDIDRFIDVLTSIDNVVAVGGAVKEMSTGEWSNGCLQIELREYTLYYDKGYEESYKSCLKCDILKGPFLIRTEFLKLKKFNDQLKMGYYDDWFMRINPGYLDRWKNDADHHKGIALSCPDVMSRVTTLQPPDSDLLAFADKWDIKRIIDENGGVHWFGCRRGIKHRKPMCKFLQGMSVPPCCLANLADSIKFFMETCKKYKITCELQEGTLLGAVKFNGILHWERDADITFLTADFEKLRGLANFFSSNGYYLGVRSEPWCCFNGTRAGGVFSFGADQWNIELYGQHKMESYDDVYYYGELPTKIDLAGQMVYVPNNPGLYARNRYGREVYKHAEHWMTNNMRSGWASYSPGSFKQCAIKHHHGCLDQFAGDGNVQFISRKGGGKWQKKQPALRPRRP